MEKTGINVLYDAIGDVQVPAVAFLLDTWARFDISTYKKRFDINSTKFDEPIVQFYCYSF